MPTAGVWNLGPLHPFSNLGLTFSWGPSFPGKMQAVFGSSYGSEHGDLRPKRVVDIGHLTWANRCFYCVCVTPQKKNRPTCPKVVFNCTRTSLFFWWKPPKKPAIFCRFPSHPVFHCQHFRLPTCWPTPNEHWGDSSHQ